MTRYLQARISCETVLSEWCGGVQGKQIGGGAAGRGGEQDAFNLQGPGTNQSRAAEIQKLNPAKVRPACITPPFPAWLNSELSACGCEPS